MADLISWENSVLGQKLNSDGVKADAGQCSQVPISWGMYLFPGVKWSDILVAVGSNNTVDKWAGKSTKYMAWIENNHKDVNQLPLPGDVVVIDKPVPHTGVVKSASTSGYTLIQQNAPRVGDAVNDASYTWSARHVLGWFRPQLKIAVSAPATPPAAAPPAAQPVNSGHVGQWVNFPAAIKSWWTYNVDGPYDDAHHAHVLLPGKYGGYSRQITKDLGNGVVVIVTQSFGPQAVIVGQGLSITPSPELATA